MDIQTDHQIVTFGNDKMMLFDSATGDVIVNADRAADNTWTVVVAGHPDVAAIGRESAVTAMTEQALAALPGTGYSTLVPNAVWDLPL